MKKFVVITFLLLCLLGCSANTGNETTTYNNASTNTTNPYYDTNNTVYILDVYLDEESSVLQVEGELYYKNDDINLDELYLTLYPNARNPSDREYNVDMQYLAINDLEQAFEIRGDDDTQIYIELDEILDKGERISIQFEYEFNYWDEGRLTDYGDYYLTMFFYPFVAMYDDEGWNIDAFTFRGESYYNDIGDYYVSINTPDTYLVATGGMFVSQELETGRQTTHYELKDARDFSFSASKDYTLYEYIANDRTYQIYSNRELMGFELASTKATISNTFEYFEDEIGVYPYDHFTIELGHYYGMESTGVIYCSSEEISEGTINHEIIHQWFYSMVGNDQSDESFLDEAVTTFMQSLYYYNAYGIAGYIGFFDFRNSLQERFDDRYALSLGESLLRKVDEFGDQYGYQIYYHGSTLFFYYVEEFLDGDKELFYDIMQVYFQRYQYKIATIDDLLNTIEEESGIDNTKEWFMMQITEFQDLDNRP